MSEQVQTLPSPPPETRQFDFWLGEWELRWGDDGRGVNRIERVMGDHVVMEHFEDLAPNALEGTSVSVFNTRTGKWHQTWVDNAGSYLDFVGEFADGKMILSRDAITDGHPVKQRMVFFNITPGSLDWNWERSEDGGKSWQTVWAIHYTRKA